MEATACIQVGEVEQHVEINWNARHWKAIHVKEADHCLHSKSLLSFTLAIETSSIQMQLTKKRKRPRHPQRQGIDIL